MNKPNLSRKEARWLEILGQFGISKISLKPGRVHVLGDVLSRRPHVMSAKLELGNAEVSMAIMDLAFGKNYLDDQMFGPIIRHIQGDRSLNIVQFSHITRLIPYFVVKDSILSYKGLVCVPRKFIRHFLHLVC